MNHAIGICRGVFKREIVYFIIYLIKCFEKLNAYLHFALSFYTEMAYGKTNRFSIKVL